MTVNKKSLNPSIHHLICFRNLRNKWGNILYNFILVSNGGVGISSSWDQGGLPVSRRGLKSWHGGWTVSTVASWPDGSVFHSLVSQGHACFHIVGWNWIFSHNMKTCMFRQTGGSKLPKVWVWWLMTCPGHILCPHPMWHQQTVTPLATEQER